MVRMADATMVWSLRPEMAGMVERMIATHALLRDDRARFVIVSAATNPVSWARSRRSRV